MSSCIHNCFLMFQLVLAFNNKRLRPEKGGLRTYFGGLRTECFWHQKKFFILELFLKQLIKCC